MTRVSVVVPARNAERSLEPLLAALARQTLPQEDWELIVADDASGDGTSAAVERSGLGRVVRLQTNEGSYAARNLALHGAAGVVLAFTDSDCRPEPGWLEQGLAQLDTLEADLLAGAIEIPLSARPTLAEMIDVAAGLDQERYVRELGFGATANLFVRRAVVDAIGPFNPRLISGGDVEFSRRATADGFRLEFSPLPRVSHEARTRGRQLIRQSFRVGFGMGQWGHVEPAVLREGDAERPWATFKAWRPRHGVPGIERLGRQLSGVRLAALDVAQYAFVQLPRNLGGVAASIRSGKAS